MILITLTVVPPYSQRLMKGLQLVGTNMFSRDVIIKTKESVSSKWIWYRLLKELVWFKGLRHKLYHQPQILTMGFKFSNPVMPVKFYRSMLYLLRMKLTLLFWKQEVLEWEKKYFALRELKEKDEPGYRRQVEALSKVSLQFTAVEGCNEKCKLLTGLAWGTFCALYDFMAQVKNSNEQKRYSLC